MSLAPERGANVLLAGGAHLRTAAAGVSLLAMCPEDGYLAPRGRLPLPPLPPSGGAAPPPARPPLRPVVGRTRAMRRRDALKQCLCASEVVVWCAGCAHGQAFRRMLACDAPARMLYLPRQIAPFCCLPCDAPARILQSA